jgi:hypothetical protein
LTQNKVSRAPAPPPSIDGRGFSGPSEIERRNKVLADDAARDELRGAVQRYVFFVERGFKADRKRAPWGLIVGRAAELRKAAEAAFTKCQEAGVLMDAPRWRSKIDNASNDWDWECQVATTRSASDELGDSAETMGADPWIIPSKEPARSRPGVWFAWIVMKSNEAWKNGKIPRPLIGGRPKFIELLTKDVNDKLRAPNIGTLIGHEMMAELKALGGNVSGDCVRRALGLRA